MKKKFDLLDKQYSIYYLTIMMNDGEFYFWGMHFGGWFFMIIVIIAGIVMLKWSGKHK